MKLKPTLHLRERVAERLGISTVEVINLYRAGRVATAADLPRFGMVALKRGSKAKVASHNGRDVLIITCPRGRHVITVLLEVEIWDELKKETRHANP